MAKVSFKPPKARSQQHRLPTAKLFLGVGLLVVVVCLYQAQKILISNNERSSSNNQQTPPSSSKTEKEEPVFKSYWDLISYYSQDYDMDGLHEHLKTMFDRCERNPKTAQVETKLAQGVVDRGAGMTYTTEHKLKHDIEQSLYLSQQKHLQEGFDEGFVESLWGSTVPKIYESVLGRVSAAGEAGEFDPETEFYHFHQEDYANDIGLIYNKALHVPGFGEHVVDDDNGNPVSVLNKKLDPDKIQRQWFGEYADEEYTDNDETHISKPGIVVVDDIMSPQALQRVRQLLMESTVWYETKTRRYGGYVGAYINDGLHDRLLMELAFELHKALPRIMTGHPLKYMWAYKYDSEQTGIHTHADSAAVNVNIWITPDDANLDKDSGGLVVYTVKPPPEWDFDRYNNNWERVNEDLLKPTNFANVTVPYKQNRAIIFDSALFHHTDKFKFKSGYENRRINLTLLYGNMKPSSESPKDDL